MHFSNITRFRAFSIHFLISFVIFLILLYLILGHWYPQPYFLNDGGWRVIRIIVGVDLVLGPLLTLIVFKPGKPGLKFDLSVIALVQVLALSWGIWTTYSERPVAVIYTIDYFTPVPAYQLKAQGLTSDKLQQYGSMDPVLIFSDIPQEKQSEVLIESMHKGKPLYLLTEYYRKFSSQYAGVLKQNSMNLEKYVDDKPELKKRYQKALVNLDASKTHISFLALHSRDKWVSVIFDLDSMSIIDTIDISPSHYLFAQKVKRTKKKK